MIFRGTVRHSGRSSYDGMDFDELDRVVGRSGAVKESDLTELVYLTAVVPSLHQGLLC